MSDDIRYEVNRVLSELESIKRGELRDIERKLDSIENKLGAIDDIIGELDDIRIEISNIKED